MGLCHDEWCAAQEGVKPTDIESITAAQFKLADTDGDGCISYEEFVAYYGLLAISRARQELRTALGPQAESEPLLQVFPQLTAINDEGSLRVCEDWLAMCAHAYCAGSCSATLVRLSAESQAQVLTG